MRRPKEHGPTIILGCRGDIWNSKMGKSGERTVRMLGAMDVGIPGRGEMVRDSRWADW